MTAPELAALCQQTIDEIRGSIEAYEERTAIERERFHDGLTTTARALAALKRPERFQGEHQIARAWLRNYAPNSGIFERRTG